MDNWEGVDRRNSISNSNIETLKKLTARLTDTIIRDNILSKNLNAGDRGDIVITPVYRDVNVGVVMFTASDGAEHELHYHPMTEWVGVAQGKIISYFSGDGGESSHEINSHAVLEIPAFIPHKNVFVGDTYGFAITMPKDEGF